MAELTLEHLKSFYDLSKISRGYGDPDPELCAALVDNSDKWNISLRQCKNPRVDGAFCKIHSKQAHRRAG